MTRKALVFVAAVVVVAVVPRRPVAVVPRRPVVAARGPHTRLLAPALRVRDT